MTKVELKFHDYKYLPYEQHLAEMEVRRLFESEPQRINGSLHVDTLNGVHPYSLERLTYFRHAIVEGNQNVIPQQARLEASATKHKDPSQLRRQHTRYSAHGLHTYRGKFNPQMVRAVTNLLGLSIGDRIWDPFCGSGTVLLEARHQGFNAVGVDLNPLAVTIANAKLSAITASPDSLKLATETVTEQIQTRAKWVGKSIPNEKTIAKALGNHWLERFTCPDYLTNWFPVPVLAQLRIILDLIDDVVPTSLRDVFRIILSDILRDVSWQDPGDLRVRRRKSPATNYPATEIFVSTLHSRVDSILAAQEYVSPYQGWQSAFLGDSGELKSLNEPAQIFLEAGIDSIISSPPYSTALPYIDTQRLSIALFGLATVKEIRELDSALIGSRELSTKERHTLEESIDDNRANVPEEAWKLCKTLKDAYAPESDGFRRQNTPAVVYRYFIGMTRVMATAKRCLRKGGSLAFIVGPNRTSLGGVTFNIDTPALLASIGTKVGLDLSEMYELNAYSRYDVHSRNSIREEKLLIMKQP